MKTVLHLSSSSGPGGAERIVCALAASLDKSQYRSLVGLFRPGWLKDQCDSRGLATYVLSNEGFMHWRWMRDCYRLIKKEQVDVIQAHEFDAIIHGALVAKAAGVPMVATVHGKHYFWEKRRRRVAYRWVSTYARMVAVSEDLKGFIVEQTGMSEDRVQVIYNGVDDAAADTSQVSQYRRDLGIPDDDWVVGVVGNLYPVKGHTYLLDAIPQILQTCPNTTFLLIGRGELEVSLKTQAKTLGIENKVRFLGLRQDVPKLLALMDLFAMPSLSEGLSIALLEAMAAGKPVVVTRVGGNPELVVEGRTGYLVPAQDAQALAQAMLALLGDPNQTRTFGARAKQLVQERFTLSHMASQYLKLYQQATSREPASHVTGPGR
jgi:glycosyltransferase involved in cell wall biosynthesis